MAYGDGREDAYCGELRMREVDEVDDETTPDDVDGLIEPHPALGRVAVHERYSVRTNSPHCAANWLSHDDGR